jgi:hypothetical protein
MPMGADILSIQVQQGIPTIWAMVDPDAPQVMREFRCLGTGYPVPKGLPMRFIDTVQLMDGELVFHVFETE